MRVPFSQKRIHLEYPVKVRSDFVTTLSRPTPKRCSSKEIPFHGTYHRHLTPFTDPHGNMRYLFRKSIVFPTNSRFLGGHCLTMSLIRRTGAFSAGSAARNARDAKSREPLNKSSAAGRPFFCPCRAVLKMGNTSSIPPFLELSSEPKSSTVSS